LISDFWSWTWKIKWKVRGIGYEILFRWQNVHWFTGYSQCCINY
jgi:hypothetical protein